MSCFCEPPLQSLFSVIPTSAPFSSVSASPSYLFLPSHLICGVTGGGFPQWGTGGRNNDWASNRRFGFPHLQMVAAAAASLCVRVYARRSAGRHRLEKRQPLLPFQLLRTCSAPFTVPLSQKLPQITLVSCSGH